RVQDERADPPPPSDRRPELAPVESPGRGRPRPHPREKPRGEDHGPEHRGGPREGGGGQGGREGPPGGCARPRPRGRAEDRVLEGVRIHRSPGERGRGPPPRAREPTGRAPPVRPGARRGPHREAREGPRPHLPQGREVTLTRRTRRGRSRTSGMRPGG